MFHRKMKLRRSVRVQKKKGNADAGLGILSAGDTELTLFSEEAEWELFTSAMIVHPESMLQ